ncbi:MAG TPA: acyl-ACP desaturase, partial [Chthonomonadales bacterium]|nr:acyl-ACP desaturase [Chthonomonadales bacterium]
NLVRQSHGRSHFQLRWGAEEERHANTWENALLFSRQKTPRQIDEYKACLRARKWELPWDDPLHMMVYTTFQERATQLNYMNMGRIASGQPIKPEYADNEDPVLAEACKTLSMDEAAHYLFFLEGTRLYLYYFPEETLEAIYRVITHFAMPAQNIIPNWEHIAEAIYRTGVYGPREYSRNVLQPVFENLGISGRKALEDGIKRSRQVPDVQGEMRQTALWGVFDPGVIEGAVLRNYERFLSYEKQVGFDQVDPIAFVPNPDYPHSPQLDGSASTS